MVVGQGVYSISLNGLEVGLLVEEEEDAAVDAVQVAVHKHFGHGDTVKLLLPLASQSQLCDGLQLFRVQQVEEGADHEQVLVEHDVLQQVPNAANVKLSFHPTNCIY